jgi:hypothetical protein
MGGIPVFLTNGEAQVPNPYDPISGAVKVAQQFVNYDPRYDAFGRHRISQVTQLFDSKLVNNNAPTQYADAEISGGGTSSTYTQNKACVELAVTANTAGKRVRQSYQCFNYQPAKSQLIFMTFVLGEATANNVKRVGYFNDNNGIFLQATDGVYSLGIRSNTTNTPVDTLIPQSRWNLDKLDGTGPSGLTVDFTKAQIMMIDFEWLGVGRVRWAFVIDGRIIYVHGQNHANVISDVYMSSPNCPVRWEIENDGAGAADTLKCICCSVSTEGGRDQLGAPRAVATSDTQTLSGQTDTYALLTIRGQSGKDTSVVRLGGFQCYCETTDTILVSVIANATINDSANLTWNPVNLSVVEAATGNSDNTVNMTNAVVLYQFYAYGRTESIISSADIAALTESVTGSRSSLSICALARTANPKVAASINWREI